MDFSFSVVFFAVGIFVLAVAAYGLFLAKDRDLGLILATGCGITGVFMICVSNPVLLYSYPRDLAAAQQALEQNQPAQCDTTLESSPISPKGIYDDTVEVQRSGNTYTSTDLGEKVQEWPNASGVFYKVYDAAPGFTTGSVVKTSCAWRQGLAEVGKQTRYEVYLPKG